MNPGRVFFVIMTVVRVLYIAFGEHYHFPRSSVWMLETLLFFRCLFMGFRYATEHEEVIDSYKKRLIPQYEFSRTFIFRAFVLQVNRFCPLLVHEAMVREQVENLSFHFKTLSKIDPQLEESLNDFETMETL
jgi:hypothetical protein